jgi:glutamine amidotransferase
VCRWNAYFGQPLVIDELLYQTQHGLIDQSLHARQGVETTNGDGFGVGWYGEQAKPGVFRDTLPAWNDANLRNLAEQISSRLFFAHVRASTGTSTSRENCHPFRRGRFLFMHNGAIGGFHRIRRAIERLIPDDIYADRIGTTDSEAFFLLACANGLENDVPDALKRTVTQILDVMEEAKVAEPFHMASAVSDGQSIYALRYSNDARSPSLYYATGSAIETRDAHVHFTPGEAAVLVLSEPLDEAKDGWLEIPEAHILQTVGGATRIAEFKL